MRAVLIAVACLSAALSIVAHAATCDHKPVVEFPMVPNDLGSPIFSILIDGRPRNALLDTGGFWSMLNPSIARYYGPKKAVIAGRLGLEGIKIDKAVTAPSMQIGPVKIFNADFYVAPDDYSDNAVTLGANWLSRFDIEIDPVGSKVVFFPRDACGPEAVYWPHRDLAELPVTIDRVQNLVTIPLMLDGHEIRALLDTGATETYISERVAGQLFGLRPDSPGTQREEMDSDKAGSPRRLYRYQFGSLSLGGVTVPHPWMTIAPMTLEGPDMILGMHQLIGLHLYFAYGERKLYATTTQGDIAAQKAGAAGITPPHRDPVAMTSARDDLYTAADALRRNDYVAATAAIDRAAKAAPDYAPVYVERAELLATRGERDRAIADLTHAIDLDSKNAGLLLERSQLYTAAGDYDRALADANRAVALEPGSNEPHAVRAEAYAADGAIDRAMQDATFAIRLDPKDIAGWLTRSHVYGLSGDYDRAYADADHAVRLEPRSSSALNSRCWTGAILARLDSALSDCNAAIAIRPYSAEILDSRAFVHLKAGRLEAALADYSAALQVDPSFASSLYGRGLVEQRLGDESGANADLAAARKADPQIERHFGK
jgi:tetratricopeptide (TPR) repeat protein/predicted aspartyl protease